MQSGDGSELYTEYLSLVRLVQQIESNIEGSLKFNELLTHYWNLSLKGEFEDLKKMADGVNLSLGLIGPRGSGKSTLVNALLGVELLPEDNSGTCTAARTEVYFEDTPHYTLKSFFREQNDLLEDFSVKEKLTTDFEDYVDKKKKNSFVENSYHAQQPSSKIKFPLFLKIYLRDLQNGKRT
eukprot:TRINITY_DN2760_c0_g1_i3.p1 TRINITY_DN2760_c0_g1~~TRINITY_DN2760_c0_g1_i3.p1  ORF type:complete len:181 (+),score=42.70 TRINITY_DN2760_c0_g1_i3:276-818(+)